MDVMGLLNPAFGNGCVDSLGPGVDVSVEGRSVAEQGAGKDEPAH